MFVCLVVALPLADKVCLHITFKSDQSTLALCRYKSTDKTYSKEKGETPFLDRGCTLVYVMLLSNSIFLCYVFLNRFFFLTRR